jgi:RHS repeat-associated protein
MGCLKLEYQPQERVLEENTLFLEKGLEKKGSGLKKRVRAYRYGFNGQERTDELKGAGNHYTAQFWEYDPRLGRRWNLDPKPNPSISQYATFENSPIWFSDPYGDSVNIDINKMYEKKDGKFVNFEQAYAFEQFIQTKEGKEYILDNAQAGFTFTGQITGASLSASKSGKNSKNVNLNFTVGNTGVEKDVFGDDVYGLGLTTFDIKDGLLSMTHTVVEQSI